MHPRADRPVVVCGAGAAGLSAALAAARHGAQVLLLEAASKVGGTVANALIHTLGGLYDAEGKELNDGLPHELIERLGRADPAVSKRKMGRMWVVQVCPNSYQRTVTGWIDAESGIELLLGAKVTRVVQSDDRIVEVEIATAQNLVRIKTEALIDATGTAAIARLIDPLCVIDSERRAAGGWIFRLQGVAPGALEFPKGLAAVRALRAAVEAGILPPECRQAWIDRGIRDDEAFVKLFVPLGTGWSGPSRFHEIEQRAQATQARVVEVLRQLPDFARATVSQAGSLGVRDGGRIRGRYVLSVDDVRTGRTFADGVCRCAWPIEFWDPEDGLVLEYLPSGSSYQIPMRSLQLAGVENFWVAGKCLSADRYAHASARVAGTCWAMGQAVGVAVAGGNLAKPEQHHELESVRPASSECAAMA
jgi:hypothetical protein